MIRIALAIALCLSPALPALALSCKSGIDPYDALEAEYNRSDFVFVGQVVRSSFGVPSFSEVEVEGIWKGPEKQSFRFKADHSRPHKIGERKVFFVSRVDGGGDRWRETLAYSCIPRIMYPQFETMILESVGTPIEPSELAIGRVEVAFSAAIFLALGGLAIFTWRARDA